MATTWLPAEIVYLRCRQDPLNQGVNLDAIDIYTGHYYPPSIAQLETQSQLAQRAHKVFLAEEYDWNTDAGSSLRSFLSAVEDSGIAGDMYWSLFPHGNTSGYVQHNEHSTLHYPGDTPDMLMRVSLLCAHAYEMQGLLPPTKDVPGTPLITSVEQNKIAWRGAVDALTYTIERSEDGAHGPWTIICNQCATDNNTPWYDATQPGGSLWYRVKGVSSHGASGAYSQVYASDP